jgi:uncharacterized membrane protein YgaE (UPF0421/DUF939 family)
MSLPSPTTVAQGARRRVAPHLAAVVQTALAALGAWLAALLLLPSPQPSFAAISAVICLGIAHGQRRRRTFELIGGVVIGISVATLLLSVIGSGPLQIGVLVVLAMTAALLLRGGELLVNEAAISAILLAAFQAPDVQAFSADRILEGLIGGAVALVVGALVLPPAPMAMAGSVAQDVFTRLERTLRELATALAEGDAGRANGALRIARATDERIDEWQEVLSAAEETARLAPSRRGDLAMVRRYAHALPQIDYAVRNTRVLARHATRLARGHETAPDGLPDALLELAGAVRALAGQYVDPHRPTDLRRLALTAAWRAAAVHERDPGLGAADVAAQVRLIAVDLVRAADRLVHLEPAGDEPPTEELLAVQPAAVLAAA